MSELRDLLVLFEWLSARSGCSVEEACDRFGLDREELGNVIDTLAQVGFLPESPDLLLSAYIDDETDTVHVSPFAGLEQGVSIELETALRLDTLATAFIGIVGSDAIGITQRAFERLRAALRASGVDPGMVAADLALPGSEHVGPLGRAISDRAQLTLRYHAAGGENTERIVDPIGLFLDGSWYLDAFDHLREARRSFKLERIIEIEPTGATVQEVRAPIGSLQVEPGSTEIVLELAPEAGWLLEHLEGAEIVSSARGRRRVRVTGGGFRWLIPLLLTAGAHATVIAPDALRDALRDEIDATLRAYN